MAGVRHDIRELFGKRIRDLRTSRRLSQEALAERAGLHRNYIGGIERGERNVAIIAVEKLAAGLDVSLAELFEPFSAKPRRR